jgi:hypothetical protein
MKSARESRKKAARRTTETPIQSASKAGFAKAAAKLDGAVIGFDRNGRTVAALVPVEAVYMLAGLGGELDDKVRRKIERAAQLFVHNASDRIGRRAASASEALLSRRRPGPRSKSKRH